MVRARFFLEVLWAARQEHVTAAAFAADLQRFCKTMAEADDRLAVLKRGQGRGSFAELAPEKAAALVHRDASVVRLSGEAPGDRYASFSAASGALLGWPSTTPGSIQLTADETFWVDEDRIRRVAAALIDFWGGGQAVVFAPDLLPQTGGERRPWCFWLDWRRTSDMPTLLPDVAVSGRPSIERAWHGGVERLWPEYAPWKHVEASDIA